VACLVLPVAAVAVDLPAVSGESVPFGVGESRKTLRMRDGKEVPQVGLRVSENKLDRPIRSAILKSVIDRGYSPLTHT
jgi:hypothetical protein